MSSHPTHPPARPATPTAADGPSIGRELRPGVEAYGGDGSRDKEIIDAADDARNETEGKGKGGWFATVKTAVNDFIADDAMTQAAAVAFYTALSFAPIILITMVLTGLFLGQGTQERVVEEIRGLIGGPAAGMVQTVQEQAEEPSSLLTFTGILGLLTLIYSATYVFVQLQAAFNHIWDVEQKPGQGVWGWIRTRLWSVGMVFTILFLLLSSLMVTAVLNAMLATVGIGGAGGDDGSAAMAWMWRGINFAIQLLVYTALFAAMFKFLPDVRIPWRAVWGGAFVTAVLFAVGNWGISLYLSHGEVAAGYGGAGGLIVLLLWVYYSALILFFGAELTQAGAKHLGFRIRPSEHAQREGPKQKEAAHGEASAAP